MAKSVFCIGGVGGSGTRLVTKLLHDHDVPIGHSLNVALDNLFFTLLFRRPSWFSDFPSNAIVLEAIDVYFRNMACSTGKFDQTSDEAYINKVIESGDTTIFDKEQWRTHIEAHLNGQGTNRQSAHLWGWKEPNTQVFLPQLNLYNNKIKYVHVIRDGFYMMNSKNKFQLKMWGSKFDVKSTNQSYESIDALKFWIYANYRTVSFGKDNMGDRFYLLDYDKFCSDPENESIPFLSFLDIPIDNAIVKALTENVNHKKIDREQRNATLEKLPKDITENYHQLLKLLQ